MKLETTQWLASDDCDSMVDLQVVSLLAFFYLTSSGKWPLGSWWNKDPSLRECSFMCSTVEKCIWFVVVHVWRIKTRESTLKPCTHMGDSEAAPCSWLLISLVLATAATGEWTSRQKSIPFLYLPFHLKKNRLGTWFTKMGNRPFEQVGLEHPVTGWLGSWEVHPRRG